MRWFELPKKKRALAALGDSGCGSVPRKYIYIYDRQGTELHCIKHQRQGRVTFVTFLLLGFPHCWTSCPIISCW